MRLQNFEDRFIYVVKYLDENISKYLTESQEAINFYYTKGFLLVSSSPLTRSSYHADEDFAKLQQNRLKNN